MASNGVHQQHNDSASTIASDNDGGWELSGIESNNNNELLAKLAARMTALEADNKRLNEQKGLFSGKKMKNIQEFFYYSTKNINPQHFNSARSNSHPRVQNRWSRRMSERR
jgi:hypothetical protein